MSTEPYNFSRLFRKSHHIQRYVLDEMFIYLLQFQFTFQQPNLTCVTEISFRNMCRVKCWYNWQSFAWKPFCISSYITVITSIFEQLPLKQQSFLQFSYYVLNDNFSFSRFRQMLNRVTKTFPPFALTAFNADFYYYY